MARVERAASSATRTTSVGEPTALDQNRVARRRAFVVGIDRHHQLLAVAAVRVVDHRDQLARDRLADEIARHRAAEHEVGLARVAHGFVGQDAGEVGAHHDGVQAAARGDGMALVLQLFVQAIEHRREGFDREVEVGETALAGDPVEHLDRRAVEALGGQRHVADRALDAVQHLAALAGRQPLAVVLVLQHEQRRLEGRIALRAPRMQLGEPLDAFLLA